MALTLMVETKCPGCGSVETVPVDETRHAAWRQGEHIQRAMPELSDAQRERLITGLCGPCFDRWTAP